MTRNLPLAPGAHVVILHRWCDRYALYENYIDHLQNRITYVVTPTSRPSVSPDAAAIVTVDDITDLSVVRTSLAEPVRRLGAPVAVIALQEGDLPVASRLREEHGCPGRKWADLHHFLDKEEMLDAAAATGVPVPASWRVGTVAEIEEVARECGWPLVVKPLQGRASAGVRRLDGPSDLPDPGEDFSESMLVQQHIPLPVYHADGYFDGGGLESWRLARYVNIPSSCTHGPLAFNDGEPVGEVEVNDARLRAAVQKFLEILVPGMSPEPWVFHCELFVDENAESPGCVFLEVGCRPGGGEIPFVWREVYGVDLMELEFFLQCGFVPEAPRGGPSAPVGGSLLVPLVGPRPACVTEVTSMLGRSDGPYAECLPAVGSVVTAATGTYEYVGGRFRFSGGSTADVTRQIIATARDYVVRSQPLAERSLQRQGA